MGIQRQGSLRLDLSFAKALANVVNLIVLFEVSDVLEIDRNRNDMIQYKKYLCTGSIMWCVIDMQGYGNAEKKFIPKEVVVCGENAFEKFIITPEKHLWEYVERDREHLFRGPPWKNSTISYTLPLQSMSEYTPKDVKKQHI